jgi:hypothetical protein
MIYQIDNFIDGPDAITIAVFIMVLSFLLFFIHRDRPLKDGEIDSMLKRVPYPERHEVMLQIRLHKKVRPIHKEEVAKIIKSVLE